MDDIVARLREIPIDVMATNSDRSQVWCCIGEVTDVAAKHIEELEAKLKRSEGRAEMLWETLMAISAATKGRDVDISGLYWPSFVTDVRAALGKKKDD